MRNNLWNVYAIASFSDEKCTEDCDLIEVLDCFTSEDAFEMLYSIYGTGSSPDTKVFKCKVDKKTTRYFTIVSAAPDWKAA